jgi:hypothetical protein
MAYNFNVESFQSTEYPMLQGMHPPKATGAARTNAVQERTI